MMDFFQQQMKICVREANILYMCFKGTPFEIFLGKAAAQISTKAL